MNKKETFAPSPDMPKYLSKHKNMKSKKLTRKEQCRDGEEVANKIVSMARNDWVLVSVTVKTKVSGLYTIHFSKDN